MINVNNLKAGITFQENGELFIVLDASHSKQGRGQASVKVKVKNLRSGVTTVKTYTGGDKVSKAHISKVEMDYLYNDGTSIILMDSQTFEQVEIQLSKLENELKYLKDGQRVLVRKFENEILDIELPINIEYKVIEAPIAIKGNTANNPQKIIKLETGLEIDAPMFIKEGETVIVSTETGKYIGRGK